MTSAAESRRPTPSDGEAILNALPNPVLLVAPDGKIVDANMAAESFFEISTQFLQRQSLKELVPFGSPLLALIDQVRSSGSPVNEYKVDLGTPRIGGDRQVDLHVAPLTERPGHIVVMLQERPGGPACRATDRTPRAYRRDAPGAHHRGQDGPPIDASKCGPVGDRAGRHAGA